MNPDDRQLIVAIGQAARTCAMYRQLLEVARQFGHQDETQRLSAALNDADVMLAELIARALDDTGTESSPPAAGGTAPDSGASA